MTPSQAVCKRFSEVLPSLERIDVSDISQISRHRSHPQHDAPGQPHHEKLGAEEDASARQKRYLTGGGDSLSWGQPLHVTLRQMGPERLKMDDCKDPRRILGLDLKALKWIESDAVQRVVCKEGSEHYVTDFQGSISDLVAACHSLQQLLLPRGAMCPDSMPLLSSSLLCVHALKSLSLDGSRIGKEGAVLLARGLSRTCSLTSLSVSAMGARYCVLIRGQPGSL